jgi:hypothetical protein
MRVWTRGRDGKQGDHFLPRGKPSDEHCTIREPLPPTFNPTSKDGATALKRPKVTVVKATAAKAGRLPKAAEEKGQLIYVISIHYFNTLKLMITHRSHNVQFLIFHTFPASRQRLPRSMNRRASRQTPHWSARTPMRTIMSTTWYWTRSM